MAELVSWGWAPWTFYKVPVELVDRVWLRDEPKVVGTKPDDPV